MKKFLHYYILLAAISYVLVGMAAILSVSNWIGDYYFIKMGQSTLDLATVAVNSLDITNEQLKILEEISFNKLLENSNNQKLNALFKKTSLNDDIKYVYVLRKLDENKVKYYVTNSDKEYYEMPVGTALEWIWLMDVIVNEEERTKAEADPDYYADKNRYVHLNKKIEELYVKKEVGYFINNDTYGCQISALVPIYTQEGDYIGLLGVDSYSDCFYKFRSKVILVLFLLLFVPTSALLAMFFRLQSNYKKEMKSIAFKDKLTGLYSRTYYENYAKQQLKKLRRAEDSITVIMMDLDNYKSYNDNYGHINGDMILKKVGMVISDEIELAGGCAGRYGGDEFIAFIPNLSLEKGDLLCESICRKLEHLEIISESCQNIQVITISLGIYTSTKKDEPFELENLIDKADNALYLAKKSGKNCFRRAF
ncbi:MAG: GGDEF domain-containing protein [Lachnospiraceae bacterium]|nr:GGDEF domain-containing protein [Lachnospiraceae bacterium]